MQWIKRNLYLVLGGVVALGLLGFAGFYLFTKVRQDQAVTEDLNGATARLETLARRDPYPNPENIAAAKEEGVRLQGFLSEVGEHFMPAQIPQELNPMAFRAYLDNTRAKLLADAQLAGVEVPTNYWFTFSGLSGTINFKPSILQPLATQLADIRSICQVLFDAKVNSLVWLKRVSVDSSDTSLGSQDYLSSKAVTNTYSVVMPYEVAFQGFSSELAAVLDGLARLPHCLVVTNVIAEPAATATTPTTDETAQMGDLASRYGGRFDPMQAMRDRYGGGMGGRYGGRGARGMANLPAVMPPPVQRPVQRGPATILDEKPLRFILSLTAVNLNPTAK
jgi:hypothetical protein